MQIEVRSELAEADGSYLSIAQQALAMFDVPESVVVTLSSPENRCVLATILIGDDVLPITLTATTSGDLQRALRTFAIQKWGAPTYARPRRTEKYSPRKKR